MLSFFNWQPKNVVENSNTQAKPRPAAAKIIDMLNTDAPQSEIITEIDKLTLAELNELVEPGRHGGTVYDFSPKVSLLRAVYAIILCGNKNKQYPDLEKHLLAKGVEQDLFYQWMHPVVVNREADDLDDESNLDSEGRQIYKPSPYFANLSNYDLTIKSISWIAENRSRSLLDLSGEDLNIDRVKQLIDTLSKDQINQPLKYYGITLLHLAAALGLTDITEYLLAKGANVNQKGGDLNMSPLLYALASPYIDSNYNELVNLTAEILLVHGADKSEVTSGYGGGAVLGRIGYGFGETVLDICAKRDNKEMALQFLRLGVSPYATSGAMSQAFMNKVCEENGMTQHMRFCNLL